jgi:hypothetical protein
MTQKLEEVFDVEPVEQKSEENNNLVVIQDSKEAEDADYDYARGYQYELLMTGKSALGDALRILKQTDNPRAVEVLSGLLKNVSDMNISLMKLAREKEDIKVIKQVRTGKHIPLPAAHAAEGIVYQGTSRNINALLKEEETKSE